MAKPAACRGAPGPCESAGVAKGDAREAKEEVIGLKGELVLALVAWVNTDLTLLETINATVIAAFWTAVFVLLLYGLARGIRRLVKNRTTAISTAPDPNYRPFSDPIADEERDAARFERISAWMDANHKPGMSYKELLALRPPK